MYVPRGKHPEASASRNTKWTSLANYRRKNTDITTRENKSQLVVREIPREDHVLHSDILLSDLEIAIELSA
jgi:hypothetical protein